MPEVAAVPERLVIEGNDLRILRENVAKVHSLEIQEWQRAMLAMSIADYLESRLEQLDGTHPNPGQYD